MPSVRVSSEEPFEVAELVTELDALLPSGPWIGEHCYHGLLLGEQTASLA